MDRNFFPIKILFPARFFFVFRPQSLRLQPNLQRDGRLLISFEHSHRLFIRARRQRPFKAAIAPLTAA